MWKMKMVLDAEVRSLEIADANGLIGQHDARMIGRLSFTLRDVWAILHRVGRSPKLSLEGRYRIHQVLGAFSGMWSVMQVKNIRRFKDGDQAVEALISHLSRKGVRESLCAESCTLLSMLVSRRMALYGLAQGAKTRGESLQHLAAARLLERSFWDILFTGVLAEMPNSLRVLELDQKSLSRFVSELIMLYGDVEKASKEKSLPPEALVLLGRISGLSLFEGVRAQKEGRVRLGTEALVAWYSRKRNRSLRGFHATVGLGLHEFAQAYVELIRLSAVRPVAGETKEMIAVCDSLRRSAFAIFNSGTLSAVPA